MRRQPRSGRYTKLLYIQQQATSYGNPGTWANISANPTILCAMSHTADAETASVSGLRGENTIEIETPYRAGIAYDRRLIDGEGRVFDISGIINVNEQNRTLLITVMERTTKNG